MADEQTVAQRPELSERDLKMIEMIAGVVSKSTLQVQNEIKPIENPRPSKVSVFNPTGEKKPKLTRRVIFCCHEEKENELKAEEILLYNQLQPGRYNNRKWEVLEREDPFGEKNTLEIRLPVDTTDNRMELAYKAPSLVAICELMIKEAKSRPAAAKPAAQQ